MQVAPSFPRVYIDPPVFGQVNPEPAANGRILPACYQDVIAYAKDLRDNGFDVKAIVVKRKYYSSGLPASYDMSQPKAWGTISELRQHYRSDLEYVPMKVTWFDGSESQHWPDELFIIMRSKTSYDFDQMFKQQEAQ